VAVLTTFPTHPLTSPRSLVLPEVIIREDLPKIIFLIPTCMECLLNLWATLEKLGLVRITKLGLVCINKTQTNTPSKTRTNMCASCHTLCSCWCVCTTTFVRMCNFYTKTLGTNRPPPLLFGSSSSEWPFEVTVVIDVPCPKIPSNYFVCPI
jgi:hypothetical protein